MDLRLFLLIFALSCTQKTEVKIQNDKMYLYIANTHITDIKEVPWRVGPYRKQLLSQGVQIRFTLPPLSQKTIKHLYHNKQADAWLIRLRRRTLVSSQTMGYFSLLFAGPILGSPHKIYYQAPRKAAIGVYYAAASISMRLGALLCPALGHRKKIKRAHITDSYVSAKQVLNPSPVDSTHMSAKVEPITYAPININGGQVLRGDYSIDIALYNQKRKLKLSNWVKIKKTASIKTEEEVTLRGCRNTTDKKSNKFRFGSALWNSVK